jgi:hypothetical protein
MCRPSCCNNTGGQETGIAAVALVIGAALVAAKIGPFVAKTIHVALEVIRFAALTTGMVVALAVFTWAAIAMTRWQLRRKTLAVNPIQVTVTRPCAQTGPANRPDCLACGGTGRVLRAISSSGRYLPGECPVCEPVRRAG